MIKSMILLACIKLICLVYLVVTGDLTTNILKDPKIVGGYSITINEAPYQVWVAIRSKHEAYFGDGNFCGGSVISQRVVLSAAHCIDLTDHFPGKYLPNLLVVVAGGTFNAEPTKHTQVFHVLQVKHHPQWNRLSFNNDIGLIFLNGFISWNSPTVRAIALAEEPPKVGEICVSSGWGVVNEMDSSYALQQAKVPIQNIEDCKSTYPWIGISHICGGYYEGGVSPCFGDSGGPLVCSNQLAGIVSFGLECAAPRVPIVYTNVSHFILWIRKVNSTFNHSLYLDNKAAFSSRRNCNLLAMWLIILSINYVFK